MQDADDNNTDKQCDADDSQPEHQEALPAKLVCLCELIEQPVSAERSPLSQAQHKDHKSISAIFLRSGFYRKEEDIPNLPESW